MIGNNVSLRSVKGNYKVIDKIIVSNNNQQVGVINYVVYNLDSCELKVIEPSELEFLEN